MKVWKELGFKTKGEIESKIRAIVASYPDGSFLSEDDTDFMVSVFKNHPEWLDKLGVGINRVRVDRARIASRIGITRCFYIHRLDGSHDDISWHACLRPPTKKQDFAQAARHEIESQRADFKATVQYGTECDVCTNQLVKGLTHIDHAPPNTFRALIDGFIEAYQIDVDNFQTVDAHTLTLFKDRKVAQSWQQWHMDRAELRAVCRKCNLSGLW